MCYQSTGSSHCFIFGFPAFSHPTHSTKTQIRRRGSKKSCNELLQWKFVFWVLFTTEFHNFLCNYCRTIVQLIIKKIAVKSLDKTNLRSITKMIGGKKKFKLPKKLWCRELKNKVGFQLKFFCFALPFSLKSQEIENGNAKQKNVNCNPTSFSNSL